MKKILIIHGWSHKLYNSTEITDPWFERTEFVNLLKTEFEVIIVKLPGFCGTLEPKADSWSTKDYGSWLTGFINENTIEPDCIIGYSFGAPVALYSFFEKNLNTPIILISPALVRSDSVKSKFAKVFNFLPEFVKSPIRDMYLYFLSPYYRYGTTFLRNSYKRVVRESSLEILKSVSTNHKVDCIYGTDDSATDFNLVKDQILGMNNVNVHLIKDGGHNIAKTHFNQIFETIKKIVKNEI